MSETMEMETGYSSGKNFEQQEASEKETTTVGENEALVGISDYVFLCRVETCSTE
jgi:hypothetical protein